MDFTMSARQTEWRNRVISFMDKHVRPAAPIYKEQDAKGDRWKVIPILEDLKKKAKAEGLWNMFMPPNDHEDEEFHGAGLTNLEYAMLSEQMGRISFASEVFNCSAPDTGNMETIARYGSAQAKERWLKPLLEGKIRSSFAMTEPEVASSDATNIQTRIERQGDDYVINGRKWWTSGAGDPRCAVYIAMGKTNPDAPRHSQQSMVLVPADAKGIKVVRPLSVFGYDDAPHGHMEVDFVNVRVPASHLLASGTKVWIAPEGTRSHSGELGPLKKGGFILARDSGRPILPIVVSGTRRIVPTRGMKTYLDNPVRIVIRPPIQTAGRSVEELLAEVRRAIDPQSLAPPT